MTMEKLYERLCEEFGLRIDPQNEFVGRYSYYGVILFFPDSNTLSIWGSEGFVDVNNYKSAVKQMKRCLKHIENVEYKRKIGIMNKKLLDIETDFD